jgi:hypothetical protein
MPPLAIALGTSIALFVLLYRNARRAFILITTALCTISTSLTLVIPADFGLYSIAVAACVMAVFNSTLCALLYFLMNRTKKLKAQKKGEEEMATSPIPPSTTTSPTTQNDPNSSWWIVLCKDRSLEIVLFTIAILSTLLGLLVVFLMAGICIGTEPDTFSTAYSRRSMVDMCQADQECFLYATVDRTSSSLLITSQLVHGGKLGTPSAMTASFTVSSTLTNLTQEVTAIVRFKRINVNEQERFVVYANLTNLMPDTQYSVQAVYRGGGIVIRGVTALIHSLPHVMASDSFTFLVGGDIYMGDRGWNVMRAAIRNAPDAYFAVLGGDLTYDNNLPTCYRRWDEFFQRWQSIMVRSDGSLLPMLTTIGNHEGGGYLKDDDVEFYVDYFRYGAEPRMPTVHAHTVAGVLGILALDSGVAVEISSQARIIDMYLKQWKSEGRLSMTAYHVPAYPSYRSFSDANSAKIREVWSPLFEKYNLSLALEHHDHKYKRTYPIRGGAVLPGNSSLNGVVYVGDGSMGVWDSKRIGGSLPWYLEKRVEADYMLLVRVYQNRTGYCVAWNTQGEAIDEFNL